MAVIIFSAMLDISRQMRVSDFIHLVSEWNRTQKYEENIVPGVGWNGEQSVFFGDENLSLQIENFPLKGITAVRHEKRQRSGVVWDTDFVMNFQTYRMSVRLDRSYAADAVSENTRFSTPHFITLLIENGYVRDDLDLEVKRTPHRIASGQIGQLSDIIREKTRYRLPVVYVSRTFDDTEPFDTNLLASRLKGIAHVLVQDSIYDNEKIREACDWKNEYDGAAGIYFPNPSVSKRRFLYHSPQGYDEAQMEALIRTLMLYSNSLEIDSLYTWQGVMAAVLNEKLLRHDHRRREAEQARKRAEEETRELLETLDDEERRIRETALQEARAEAEMILDGFEEDLARLKKQVEDLTRVNDSLMQENAWLKTRHASSKEKLLLSMGTQEDLFAKESRDMVLSVLHDAVRNLPEKSRRQDVIRDILENNPYEKLCEERAERLRQVLKNYDGMDSRTWQALEELGFRITEEGKHYKLVYYNDPRYILVLSKTPSDHRTGKNSAANAIRMVL